MPRKIRRSPAPSERPAPRAARPVVWPGYLLCALLAAALATGITYLALRPALQLAHQAAVSSPLTMAKAEREAGNTAFDAKDWATAVSDYTQAIAEGYDNPNIRTDLGTAYRNLNQPQKAMQQYEIAQRQDPEHQNSLINEGIVSAFNLNNPTQALQLFHLYLTRFPQGQHVAAVKKLIALVQAHSTAQASLSPHV
jgi:tetratricopeptide (TPR) repeat protein